MKRRGHCHDIAVMESFFSTVKSELTERAAGLRCNHLLFEKASSDAGLSDDAGQRAKLELGMIRHRHRRCGVLGSFLHHDVAATLSNG